MTLVGKPFAAPLVGLCLAAAACHPTGVDSTSDYSTVSTAHDATYNFGAAKTYSLPNQVVSVGGIPDGGPVNPVNPQIQNAILTSIQTQMDARGYQKVATGANPDLITGAAFLEVTNVSYYYNYWCYYYPYYPCYPYYYPPVVASYTVGTVLIDLAPTQVSGNQLTGVWTAVVRGVSSGNNTTDSTRIAAGISQAFIQSPYVESAQ
jgi:hypothetical protein